MVVMIISVSKCNFSCCSNNFEEFRGKINFLFFFQRKSQNNLACYRIKSLLCTIAGNCFIRRSSIDEGGSTFENHARISSFVVFHRSEPTSSLSSVHLTPYPSGNFKLSLYPWLEQKLCGWRKRGRIRLPLHPLHTDQGT